MASVSASLAERTGRSLEEWVALVRKGDLDPLDQKAVRRWLKEKHGVLQNSRWTIADAAARDAGWSRPEVEEYVDRQYEGPKASLRPIFNRLREVIEGFGEDVTMEGRGTYTPFVRRRQFAAVAATTRTRVDVGLRYTEPPSSPLLAAATAPGQATHKLSFTSVEQVTPNIEQLLRKAYEQNG